MKAFYLVTLLFSLALGAITVNYFYISRLSQELIEDVEALPLPSTDNRVELAAKQICDDWEKNRTLVQITANHTEIEAISNAADELLAFAKYQSIPDFERARALLINALEELELSEKLSFSNIF